MILGIYLLIGYYTDPEDVCMLKGDLFLLAILMAVITLFHGIVDGLLGMTVIAIAMKLFYPQFLYQVYLNHLVLVLIFGEFHYYWNRSINQKTVEIDYLKSKLDELGKAFYTLKISHDQLEKNYVLKPMSLRNSIRSIRESFDEEQGYELFVTLLQKSFGVSEALLCAYDDGVFKTLAKSENARLIEDDTMLEMAIEKRRPIYVSSAEVNTNSNYLGVIPILTRDELTGLLMISDMPFLSFTKDNLISISILSTYFFDEVGKLKALEKMDASELLFTREFEFELLRLGTMQQNFGTDSAVLILKTEDELLAHRLEEAIRKNLRTLDMLSTIHTETFTAIAMLFPFADRSSGEGFLKRLFEQMHLEETAAGIESSFFDMRQSALIRAYVRG